MFFLCIRQFGWNLRSSTRQREPSLKNEMKRKTFTTKELPEMTRWWMWWMWWIWWMWWKKERNAWFVKWMNEWMRLQSERYDTVVNEGVILSARRRRNHARFSWGIQCKTQGQLREREKEQSNNKSKDAQPLIKEYQQTSKKMKEKQFFGLGNLN